MANLTIFRHLFESLAEEMGVTLTRAAFSPNIRERLDFSCALFDSEGALVAQAAHIPVHLGSMPDLTMRLAQMPQNPGDCWVVNSPYEGGTHLPDLTLVTPLFDRSRQRIGFAAARAHHADIGGMTPGSMPLSQEIFQEGLILPPVLLYRRGKRCKDVFDIILANVRTPREREGDLLAQLSACRQAETRLRDLEERYGAEVLRESMSALQAHSQRLTGLALEDLADGVSEHSEVLEWSSPGGLQRGEALLKVRLEICGGVLRCDFSGTEKAVPASINAARPVTCAAVYYGLLVFLGQADGIPINQGVFRCVEVVTEPGTMVDAAPPAAVAAGNVETSQRVVDLVLGALSRLFPARLPAASGSSMNNLTVGGFTAAGKPFTYYETAGGGYGGGPLRPGLSAAQIHMTNTRNTPAETLEREYPMRLWRYAVREGTGGAGTHRGGDGLVRELEFLTPVQATLLASRRTTCAQGVGGGEPGAPGLDILVADGTEKALPGQGSWPLPAGSRLRIQTPAGGGWTP